MNRTTSMVGRILVAAVAFIIGSTTALAGVAAGQLYGVNSGEGGQFLALIDKTDGSITNIGLTGIDIDGIAFSSANVLFAADNSNHQLVTLNLGTGAVDSVIGSFGFSNTIEGMAFHPVTGTLYAIDVTNDALVTISTADASVTTIGSFGGPPNMAGLSWSVDGSALYGADWTTGGLYSVDPDTGFAGLIGFGAAGSDGGPLGLAADPTDGILYTAEWRNQADMTLATVSPIDGSRSPIGTMFGAPWIESLSFTVPTPGALALLGTAGLLRTRRRRR